MLLSPPPPLVVITAVDVLRHAGSRPLDALGELLTAGVAVVLCGDECADDLIALQEELGISHPFICAGGAALHIPPGYFCGLPEGKDGDDGGWEIIDFGTRRLGHAVRLLVALYRASSSPPVIIGVAADWRHRPVLREVDTPIIVRNPAVDQAGLVRNVPSAYFTSAPGLEGWSEAILGHCSIAQV